MATVGKREGGAVSIPESAIADIVGTLCRMTRHHPIHFRLRPESRDPDDDFLLELAFVARCDFIFTHNVRHLRSASQFRISVVTPGEFLRKMKLPV